MKPRALDFFCGSGLVTLGLSDDFDVVWANDICAHKAKMYADNHGAGHLHVGSVTDVKSAGLPGADLSWASFPCQDLSSAGRRGGINAGRSGLVWEWLRVMDGLAERPKLCVAENVVGLLTANDGEDYRELLAALVARGYQAGGLVLDASHWVPQSRPRVFIVAVRDGIRIPESLRTETPNWMHPASLIRAQRHLPGSVLWAASPPSPRSTHLLDVLDANAAWHEEEKTRKLLASLSARHAEQIAMAGPHVAAGYVRTRSGMPRLELRFDGVAGCLRTAKGGSSKQIVLVTNGGFVRTRTLTSREAARLMGAPDSFILTGRETRAYGAMGDAVAVPVVRFLSSNLLLPLLTGRIRNLSLGSDPAMRPELSS